MLRWIPGFKNNRGLGLVGGIKGARLSTCPPHKLLSPWQSSPGPQTDCSSCLLSPLPACLSSICPLPAPRRPRCFPPRLLSVSLCTALCISLLTSSLLPPPVSDSGLTLPPPSHLTPGSASLLLLSPLSFLLLRFFSGSLSWVFSPSISFPLPGEETIHRPLPKGVQRTRLPVWACSTRSPTPPCSPRTTQDPG